jgi:hypothetical protein
MASIAENGCEWPDCESRATHDVTVVLPDCAPHVWHVCMEHDNSVKTRTVRDRPPAPQGRVDEARAILYCGGCGIRLDERSGALAEERLPCPLCDSFIRSMHVALCSSVEMHGSIAGKVRRSGVEKPSIKFKTGNSFTGDLQAWGTRSLTFDEEHDVYREEIVLYDGSRIVSRARLRDHKRH